MIKKSLVFPGSFYDDIVEEDEYLSNDTDDDMEDFIVDEEVVYGKGESLRFVVINVCELYTSRFSIVSLF